MSIASSLLALASCVPLFVLSILSTYTFGLMCSADTKVRQELL